MTVVTPLIERLMTWVDASAEQVDVLPDVPGANEAEARRLAVIGGLARCLIGPQIGTWPVAVRAWASAGPTPPDDLVSAIQNSIGANPDPLAELYERCVSGRHRRFLGTFFTPAAVVEYMLEISGRLLPRPSVVIDPGAGVGAFTLAAATRWSEATLVAVDVNVVTLGMLAARGSDLGCRLRLVHDDFMLWSQSGAREHSGPRLWIGNPPYTRHQGMPLALKKSAHDLQTSLVKSGLAGLSAYFLAAILQSVHPEDAVCLLLPGSWTNTRFGSPLRTELVAMLQREVGLLGFPSERQLFPGTRVTGMVLLIGPESPNHQALWSASADMLGGVVSVTGRVERSRVDVPAHGFGSWLWGDTEPDTEAGIALSEIARVRRGVATGANRFFFLTDEQAQSMPPQYIRPAIQTLRELPSSVLNFAAHAALGRRGRRRWLLELPVDADLAWNAALREWRARAESLVRDRYLAIHRDAWYAVEHIEPPDILVSPMGKGRMKAVLNAAAAVPSNAIYGIYLQSDRRFSAEQLCEWLNSPSGQHALHRRARAYGSGLFKLEPKDLCAVIVPHSVAGIAELALASRS